jgi:RimJ/RimL family protein N-acetyltransferase
MVSLRPLELRDARAVFQALDSSRDVLRRWMVWYRDDYKLADAESWIRHTLASAADGAGFHFAMIDAQGDLVGVISVEDVSHESGRGMLGYWMATHATGRGLGRQAVEQMVTWARDQSAIATLWAIVADANVASRRVLEVNGFRSAGTRGRDERGDLQLIYELELRPAPGA